MGLGHNGRVLRIATVNVNGIRAAYRKGMDEWVAHRTPDILLLQEVRAPDEVLHELLGDDWHIAHQASDLKGRAGGAGCRGAAVAPGSGRGPPSATSPSGVAVGVS